MKNNTELQNLRFEEINEGYSPKEAFSEALRCLNCKNPLCVQGCPIEHDIPGFIHSLSKGNIGDALEIINQKSNLPAICGRVCPHEKQCEGHCILNKKGAPVRVGKLERFIADFDGEMGLIHEKITPKTKGKVAVIGSGPAGLTVAGDLARDGYNVVIYEKEQELGGVLMYGIPDYRLPKDVVKREIDRIETLGVTFLKNCMVGSDITIDTLFERGFDAIFIGSGSAVAKVLDVPGKELKGIIQSTYLLHTMSLYNNKTIGKEEVPIKVGDKVGVIGAGNVAMDSARTAIRLGAKSVTIIYHRTEADMPCLRTEYNEALEEGVQFMWQASTQEFIGENGLLKAARIKTPEGETTMELDKLLLAVGSRPANRIVSTTSGIEVNEYGYVITKERPYGMTTRKGIFAGGDVVHTPKTVVLAMREAKMVAKGIAQYVEAMKLLGM